jgi:phospholipid-translocating ATPase
MILAIWLFEYEFARIVSISFTALILNELFMVALEINTWHIYMIFAQIATMLVYTASMWFLPAHFGILL